LGLFIDSHIFEHVTLISYNVIEVIYMHNLVKPNGTLITVNDKSLAYALSLGWKKQAVKVEVKKNVNSSRNRK
jgi:hypothetical protein